MSLYMQNNAIADPSQVLLFELFFVYAVKTNDTVDSLYIITI